jgi:hypothetical protein
MLVASVNLGILNANKNQNLISQTAPNPSPVIAAEIPSLPTSSEPKPLPPGTIQASAQSRRRPPAC